MGMIRPGPTVVSIILLLAGVFVLLNFHLLLHLVDLEGHSRGQVSLPLEPTHIKPVPRDRGDHRSDKRRSFLRREAERITVVRDETRRLALNRSQSTPFFCGSGQRIPQLFVNDNYCDCPDGSDENTTSACAHIVNKFFTCAKKHRLREQVGDPLTIHPSIFYPASYTPSIAPSPRLDLHVKLACRRSISAHCCRCA